MLHWAQVCRVIGATVLCIWGLGCTVGVMHYVLQSFGNFDRMALQATAYFFRRTSVSLLKAASFLNIHPSICCIYFPFCLSPAPLTSSSLISSFRYSVMKPAGMQYTHPYVTSSFFRSNTAHGSVNRYARKVIGQKQSSICSDIWGCHVSKCEDTCNLFLFG